MEIIVETIPNLGEPSARSIRVRPAAGQFDREYRVWCSVSEREAKSLRGLYRVEVSWVVPSTRQRYLRISRSDEWVPVTVAQASAFMGQCANTKKRRKRS